MKKSKFLKTLLVLVMGVVMAFAAFGFAACSPDDNSGNNGGNTDNSGGNNGGNNGGNTGGDNTGGDNTGGDNTGGDNKPSTKQDVTINVSSDLTGNVSDGAELKTGSGVTAVGSLTRSTTTRTVIHPSLDGGKADATHRVQLASNTAGLKFNLEEAATVLVYASGSNATSAGSLKLNEVVSQDGKDTETVKVESVDIGQGGVTADVGVALFELEANKVYTVKRATSSTVNVLYIAVHYSAINENKGDLVPAVPASCGVAGLKTHYLSNYGRYYTEDGTTLTQRYKLAEAALEHNYQLVPNSVTAATETAVGSAQIKCTNETEAINVELPVLGSPDYTTRPNAGETGTYTYVYQGVTITFTAQGVAQTQLTYTTVYTNDFTSGTVAYSADGAGVTAENGGKIYGKSVATDATDFTTGYIAEIADGSLHATGAEAYVGLENAINSGVVKISGEMKIGSKNGSWTFFQIRNTENKEVVGFRTNSSNGTFMYRISGGSNAGNAVSYTTDTALSFEIIMDIDRNNVTIKIGETVIADKVVLGSNKAEVSTVMLNVNNNRHMYLNSITIATQD